jgi:hypothetical protein
MSEDSYPNMCIFNTLDGLRDGLSHFSQPSRVALIYAVGPDDPIRVYDPQNLLHGHEPILKEIYFDSDDWKKADADLEMVRRFGQIQVEKNLELAGLISTSSPFIFPVSISGNPWTSKMKKCCAWPKTWPKSTAPCILVRTCICTGLPACWTAGRLPVKIARAAPDLTRPYDLRLKIPT